eukprot:Gb_17037 [translate_table: standard]
MYTTIQLLNNKSEQSSMTWTAPFSNGVKHNQLSRKDQEVVAQEEDIKNLKAELANINKCQESCKKDFTLLQAEKEINLQAQLKENNSLQAAKCTLERNHVLSIIFLVITVDAFYFDIDE